MYSICPSCGTEVTFMVDRCPVCAKIMNVFDFHKGDSPDINYPYDRNAPYVYTRGVITNITNTTETTTTYYEGRLFADSKDRYYISYEYTYLYHGRWYRRSTGDDRNFFFSIHYDIGDDVIVIFRRGNEMNGELDFSTRGYI
jgi:hypothetical protein